MRCINCGHDNPAEASYCEHCGQKLGDLSLREIESELRAQREAIEAIKNRLSLLEKQISVPSPPVGSQVSAVPPAIAVPSGETPAAPARPVAASPPLVKSRDWEQRLGGNWLARIGVIAVVVGIGFLIKFAVDNRWVTPIGWTAIGIAVGLILLGAGYYWRRKYAVLAQALGGGGIAILYVSFFAAFALFHILPLYAVIVSLFVISALSAALSLRYNSIALALIGIFGAFTAPIILDGPISRLVVPSPSAVFGQLLLYLFAVDAGILIISTFRQWRWLGLIALLGSLLLYGSWYSEFSPFIGLLLPQIGITIIFLIFCGVTLLFHGFRRKAALPFDYALMSINALAYFGISWGQMHEALASWMGGFTFLLAMLYSALAYALQKSGRKNFILSQFATGIALTLLSIAIPIQLGNRHWTTMVWATEGAVLIWLSLTTRLAILRAFAYGVFVVMAIRLIFFDAMLDLNTYHPVLNTRFLAFVYGILMLYAAFYLLRRARSMYPELQVPASTLMIMAQLLTVWVLSLEAWDYFSRRLLEFSQESPLAVGLRNARNLSLTGVWAIYAVVLIVIGIFKRWRSLRLGGLALLALPVVKVFAYDVWALGLLYRVAAFVGLGVLLILSAYLYQRYSRNIKQFLTE